MIDPALHAEVLAAVPFKRDAHLIEDLRFMRSVGPVSREVVEMTDALDAEVRRRGLTA